jgi:hypothetical protein
MINTTLSFSLLVLFLNAGQAELAATTRSVGPLYVGMSFSQAQKIMPSLNYTTPSLRPTPDCMYSIARSLPNVYFMFVNNRLVRVDILSSRVPTEQGVRVGNMISALKEQYPTGYEEPAEYDSYLTYFTVKSKDGLSGMRFEIQKGKIKRFYIGQLRELMYAEGCS